MIPRPGLYEEEGRREVRGTFPKDLGLPYLDPKIKWKPLLSPGGIQRSSLLGLGNGGPDLLKPLLLTSPPSQGPCVSRCGVCWGAGGGAREGVWVALCFLTAEPENRKRGLSCFSQRALLSPGNLFGIPVSFRH